MFTSVSDDQLAISALLDHAVSVWNLAKIAQESHDRIQLPLHTHRQLCHLLAQPDRLQPAPLTLGLEESRWQRLSAIRVLLLPSPFQNKNYSHSSTRLS